VGGGASGALTALNLLRLGHPEVVATVYEPTGQVGAGVAYATTDERHLLNVRASNMSAFPDAPADLLEWAAQAGIELAPTDFLPRRDYARYLAARLGTVAETSGDRLQVVAETVTDVEPGGAFFRLATGSDSAEYDAVVLAHGNAAPSVLSVAGTPLPDAVWHLCDPWHLSWARLDEKATVVLVGTGLTAVDTAITLLDGHPDRRVLMVSRSGLLPKPHIDEQSTAWVSPVPDGPLIADDVAAFVCNQFANAARRGVDWRWVVDGLRAATQGIWQRLTLEERRRFLTHYAREWEVRRHRMAPEIAKRITAFQAQGRLLVLGGGIAAVSPRGDRISVTVGETAYVADRLVNCTGPRSDITRTDNPLLAALQDRGLLRPDPLRLGVDCTPAGEILDRDGTVVPGLFTVGPPRRGVLYETTAIPEIRVQAAEVAGRLLTAARP